MYNINMKGICSRKTSFYSSEIALPGTYTVVCYLHVFHIFKINIYSSFINNWQSGNRFFSLKFYWRLLLANMDFLIKIGILLVPLRVLRRTWTNMESERSVVAGECVVIDNNRVAHESFRSSSSIRIHPIERCSIMDPFAGINPIHCSSIVVVFRLLHLTFNIN